MRINAQSKLISSILSPAAKLWLRSLLEGISHLDVAIQGQDRQLISGYVPKVYLNAEKAIYQGVHLDKVQVWAENTRINIGQILKGKPLQLLEPIRVVAEASILEEDLNQSLSSFILANALNDLLIFLLKAGGIENAKEIVRASKIEWRSLTLDHQIASVGGIFTPTPGEQPTEIRIRMSLNLQDAQTLEINPLELTPLPIWSSLELRTFPVDLGSNVNLEKMSIVSGQLFCSGRLVVEP
jgi:hypothetical protein